MVPPIYWRRGGGFGEGEILQKIHNVLPICQDITYYLSWSDGNGNKEFYKETTCSNFK
jgi:hypothetical protein